MKSKISPKSAKPSACWSRRFSRPAKPAKPAVFEIGESIKHKFRLFQVYRFQNWYQSNIPLKDKSGIGMIEVKIQDTVKRRKQEHTFQKNRLTRFICTKCHYKKCFSIQVIIPDRYINYSLYQCKLYQN